jgi:AcrR family transcriptional regulator
MVSEKRQPTLAMKREAAQQRDRTQYGAKRDMILKAAGPVLERNGFDGTTMDAIAKEAYLDRATLYYYFADKAHYLPRGNARWAYRVDCSPRGSSR